MRVARGLLLAEIALASDAHTAQEGRIIDGRKLTHELFGLFLIFFSLLLLLSLITFHSTDPSLNHVTSIGAKVQNKAGLFGAYLAGMLNDFFGIAAFLWPVCLGGLGAGFISLRFDICWWRWCGYVLMGLCFLASGAAWDFSIGDVRGGGMLGSVLYTAASLYLSPAGSVLLLVFVLLIATQLSFDISWMTLARRAVEVCRSAVYSARQKGYSFSSDEKGDAKYKLPVAAWWKILCAYYLALKERFSRKYSVLESMPEIKEIMAAPGKDIPELAEFEPLERPLDTIVEMPSEQATVQEKKQDNAPQKSRKNEPKKVAPTVNLDEAMPEQAVVLSTPSVPVEIVGEQTHDATLPQKETKQLEADITPNSDDASNAVPITEAEDVELVYTENGAIEAHIGGQGSAAQPTQQQGLVAMLTGEKQRAKIPFPPVDLLAMPSSSTKPSTENCEERGRQLVNCLAEFGITGTLERITPGPVVTMYEYKPAAGIRVRRIENLVDDLARAMKAKSIRIQAPIPGLDTVGIEIPNEDRRLVNFREILTNAAFTEATSPLTMVIGKDIAGRPFTADLAVMPHLLVAGATGQGKSVCINSIILSLLYKARPDELQLLLVDPKRVEFAVYADLPYLVHPVVTEMDHAKAALDWAVHEMDQRYDAMSRMGVRNIKGYNEKLQKMGNTVPPEFADCKPMPFLVIIIDELADLMMTASRREVENSIVRLAQLARAAGIHMILATQRPSVDVVTGLIKANFPCRISFKVSQKVDSRTILDAMGAEGLLGRGDMLFKPSSGRILRMHGPFVSDDEVANVVEYWKRQQKPKYQVDFSEWNTEGSNASNVGSSSNGASSDDALYGEVLEFVTEQGKASISLIQRRFKIGFNRAARLFEELEKDGVVGPADGAKPRSVVR